MENQTEHYLRDIRSDQIRGVTRRIRSPKVRRRVQEFLQAA
jgi:hypothetical protein